MALALALREIIQRELARFDPAPKHERAVAVIAGNVIAITQLNAKRGQRLVTHPANVEMPFALSVKVLLAKIAVPAFQNEGQQTQLIFAGK